MHKRILGLVLIASMPLIAQQSTQESIDLGTLNDIKAQAFYNSQVMDHLFYLSEVYGPRVTDSPNHQAAAEWVMERLKSYGLKNVHLEPWGPFGNAWQYKKFYGALVEPNYAPFIGFPLAWTPSTPGAVTAEAIYAPIHSLEDFPKYHGKLRGKIVLIADRRVLEMHTEVEAHRLTSEEIQVRTLTPDPRAPQASAEHVARRVQHQSRPRQPPRFSFAMGSINSSPTKGSLRQSLRV